MVGVRWASSVTGTWQQWRQCSQMTGWLHHPCALLEVFYENALYKFTFDIDIWHWHWLHSVWMTRWYHAHGWHYDISAHGWHNDNSVHRWQDDCIDHGWHDDDHAHGWHDDISARGWHNDDSVHRWQDDCIDHGWHSDDHAQSLTFTVLKELWQIEELWNEFLSVSDRLHCYQLIASLKTVKRSVWHVKVIIYNTSTHTLLSAILHSFSLTKWQNAIFWHSNWSLKIQCQSLSN